MKCLILLTALSYTVVYGDPVADAQFYGGSLQPHHRYGGRLPYQPYHYQPHFVAAKTEDTVKLVAADQKIPAAAVIHAGYGHGLPYGYAGALGYGGAGHLGYGHRLSHPGYGYQAYRGVGYPYAAAAMGITKY